MKKVLSKSGVKSSKLAKMFRRRNRKMTAEPKTLSRDTFTTNSESKIQEKYKKVGNKASKNTNYKQYLIEVLNYLSLKIIEKDLMTSPF